MKFFNSNPLAKYVPDNSINHQWPQIVAICAAAIGGLSTGTIASWTSPLVPILISNSSYAEPVTLEEVSYFTVIPSIAAIIASPILTILSDKIGRKKIIISISIFYFTSWALIVSARTLIVFYLARFIEGIGDAAVFTSVPMYVGEISEPGVRGSWGNLIASSMFVGQFLANAVPALCDIRLAGIILGSTTLIGFTLSIFIPESPYYLLMKNKVNEARSSLQVLRWRRDVEDELKTLNKDVQREFSESGSLKDLICDPINRKTLLISIGLRTAQPFSGQPAFGMYTQYMFEQAGTNLSGSTCAIIFTGLFVITVTAASMFVEKFGRKPLMICSYIGCFICLSIEALYFFVREQTSVDVTDFSWVSLTGLMLYIPANSTGISIIPTLMLSELFATNIKGKALAVLNIFFSIFILASTKLFQTLSSCFGMYAAFLFFAVCCFFSIGFSYYFIPETKGKTLEEIQATLKGRKFDEKC